MRLVEYFRNGIWQPGLKDYSGLRRVGFKALRTIVLAIREYRTDRCTQRASGLTFYTLVSVVPVLTMALAVARAFGLDAVVQRHVWASLSNQTELIEKLFVFANALLRSTSNTVVAGVGVAVLLWTVTSALGNIEDAFGRVWEVPHPRRFVRRLTDYTAMVIIGAVLWLVSIGIAIALQGQLGSLGARVGIPDLAAMTRFLLQAMRFLLIWGLLTTAYIIMPNTRVRPGSAALGGLGAAVLYQFVESVYLGFQTRISGFGAIYGGFAALPLFLTWVQATWMAVLFGAELAFADEHCETYGFAPDYARLGGHLRRLVHLKVLHLLVKNFEQGTGGLTAADISTRVRIPVRLLRRLMVELTGAGLIVRTVARDERSAAYQPARGADQLTLGYIIDALDGYPVTDRQPPAAGDQSLPAALRRFHDAAANAPADVRLADIPLDDGAPVA
jgi:membrane protein